MPLASGGFGDSTHPGRPGGESGERGSPAERDGGDRDIFSDDFLSGAISDFVSPTQTIEDVTGYGGINIAPYSRENVVFSDTGTQTRTFDPTGRPSALTLSLGQRPQPQEDLGFFENIGRRVQSGISGLLNETPQRGAMFSPQRAEITGPTMEKVSDNTLTDTLANILNPFKGITGAFDTADYVPLTGGETQQFSQARGGLLSAVGLGGPQFTPYSELERRNVSDTDDQGDRLTPEVLRMAQQRTPQTRSIPVPLIRLGYS